jgi:hypothetical protein
VLTAASRRTGGGGVSASTTHIDTYSSDEDDEQRKGIIDIDQVSGINDLAPTSVFRDRRTEEEKLAERIARKAKAEEKRLGRRSTSRRRAEAGDDGMVKAEPISPDKVARELPATVVDDEDDVEMGDEEDMGKTVRRFARTGGAEAGSDEDEEDEAVKRAKQMVDVDESESELEDEDLTGDFVDLRPDVTEDENGDKIVSPSWHWECLEEPRSHEHCSPAGQAGGHDVYLPVPEPLSKVFAACHRCHRGRRRRNGREAGCQAGYQADTGAAQGAEEERREACGGQDRDAVRHEVGQGQDGHGGRHCHERECQRPIDDGGGVSDSPCGGSHAAVSGGSRVRRPDVNTG